jgi:hypothetical protein
VLLTIPTVAGVGVRDVESSMSATARKGLWRWRLDCVKYMRWHIHTPKGSQTLNPVMVECTAAFEISWSIVFIKVSFQFSEMQESIHVQQFEFGKYLQNAAFLFFMFIHLHAYSI